LPFYWQVAKFLQKLIHHVTIVSVTPSSAIIGQSTLFDVVVSYELGTLYDSGVVIIGFDDEVSDCYRFVDQQTVSSGAGTVNFTGLSAVPVDWGTKGKFSVVAILEANNQQKTSAIQVISLTTGTL
jgi:hypothetical protein